MAIWVIFTFWLLWLALRWTFLSTVLFEHLLSVLLGMYLGVELPGHMAFLCLTYWGSAQLISTVALPFCPPNNRVWRSHFLHILTKTGYFPVALLIIAILVGGKWYLMVFICVSLMANNVEHLLMCLLAMCTSALEETDVLSSPSPIS